MDITPDTDKSSGAPLRIDVAAVLRQRLGSGSRRIPAWLVRRLEKLICQDRLNEMLRVAYPGRGADFCRAVTDHLDITLDVTGRENLPATSRVLIVSNHPLGGLDGMALIRVFADIYGPDLKFVVNDLLSAVEPLSDVFLPVNKHGAQSRDAIRAIDATFASDRPVLMFPAGLCSRRRGGTVADLAWQKMFVQKARESGRVIVPVLFVGQNSPRFYRWASWRERLGIKFNYEMVLLPSEIFRAEGSEFRIVIGSPVAPADLPSDPREAAAEVRKTVYSLQERVKK